MDDEYLPVELTDLYDFLKTDPRGEYPNLVIKTKPNRPNDKSNKGLKFRELNDEQIIVETNEETIIEHFTEPLNMEKLMLYNFKKIMNFCKIGTNEDENRNSQHYYIVLKNFRDEKIHIISRQECQIYNIFKRYIKFLFRVYANGKSDDNKGLVCMDIKREDRGFFHLYNKFIEKTFLHISLIDTEGAERFTRTLEVDEEPDKEPDEEKVYNVLSLYKFISREEILNNSIELLHGGDLVIFVKIGFNESFPYKNIINFERKINDTIPKVYKLDFDTEFGKKLCENSNILEKISKKNTFMTIPLDEIGDWKNILRVLFEISLTVQNYEYIGSLYRMAHRYEIHSVIEFCKRVFKKHDLYVDSIPLIHRLAEDYNDLFLREIVENYKKRYGKFICNEYEFAYAEDEKETDNPRYNHIHDAIGEYIQYDNLENANTHFKLKKKILIKDCEEKDANLNFPSVFNTCVNGEIKLLLDSDFGKIFCEMSEVYKNRENWKNLGILADEIEIPQNDLEAFKNIYRVLIGANYIKATTIFDIVSIYEVSDFYHIPSVMEICRNLFEKYICIRNDDILLQLSEKYPFDDKLKNIVTDFMKDFKSYIDSRKEYYPKWMKKKHSTLLPLLIPSYYQNDNFESYQ